MADYTEQNKAAHAKAIEQFRKMLWDADENGETLVYSPQKVVGYQIINAFAQYKRIVTLCAPMQWGKTGTLFWVAYHFMLRKWAERTKHQLASGGLFMPKIFIITGMSDNEWVEQTKSRFPPMLHANIMHRNSLKKNRETFENLNNALIIIDECHYGADKFGIMGTILREAGLTDIDVLVQRDVFILQTSATPDSTLVQANTLFEDIETEGEDWGNVHKTIIPEIPASYTGIWDFLEKGRVMESRNLANPAEAQMIISSMKIMTRNGGPKYHIIRIPIDKEKKDATMNNVLFYGRKDGFDILKHYGKHRIDIDTLKTAPERDTLILIKCLWRAAKTIENTEHIGIIHEAFSYSKSNSAENQGLIGRLCGHGRSKDNMPIIFCHKESVMNYAKLFAERFDYYHQDLCYNSGSIMKQLGVGGECGLVYRKCYLDNTDDEETMVGRRPRKPNPEKVVFEDFTDVIAFTKDILGAKRGPSIKRFKKNEMGMYTAIRHGERTICTDSLVDGRPKAGLVGKYKIWPSYRLEDITAGECDKVKWVVYYYN